MGDRSGCMQQSARSKVRRRVMTASPKQAISSRRRLNHRVIFMRAGHTGNGSWEFSRGERPRRRMPEIDMRTIALTVNGVQRRATVETRLTLADLLREEFRLTGTHVGCEHGVCGACTILLDGEAIRSCLLLAVQADGQTVETVEHLASDAEHLSPLQEQFVQHHGLQCGFCT